MSLHFSKRWPMSSSTLLHIGHRVSSLIPHMAIFILTCKKLWANCQTNTFTVFATSSFQILFQSKILTALVEDEALAPFSLSLSHNWFSEHKLTSLKRGPLDQNPNLVPHWSIFIGLIFFLKKKSSRSCRRVFGGPFGLGEGYFFLMKNYGSSPHQV